MPEDLGAVERRWATRLQAAWRGRSTRLEAGVRKTLCAVPTAMVDKAALHGLDGYGALVCHFLGKNVWARAVNNAPEEWEEEEMTAAIKDAMSTPKTSKNIWLLSQPTRHERALLRLYATRGDRS